jgi:hypothetical protein
VALSLENIKNTCLKKIEAFAVTKHCHAHLTEVTEPSILIYSRYIKYLSLNFCGRCLKCKIGYGLKPRLLFNYL